MDGTEAAVLLILPIAQAASLLALSLVAAFTTSKQSVGQVLVLLIVPYVTASVTLYFSLAQGSSTSFVSDAMNFSDHEPWSLWSIRYTLWHMTFVGGWLFKRQVYPAKIRWLADINLLFCVATLWSGFSQFSRAQADVRWTMHWISASTLGVLWAFETAVLWADGWASVAYVALTLAYMSTFLLARLGMTPDTGIPFIGNHIGTPFQWAMFSFHLVLSHLNYGRLRTDGFWTPAWCSRFGLELRGEPAGDFALTTTFDRSSLPAPSSLSAGRKKYDPQLQLSASTIDAAHTGKGV